MMMFGMANLRSALFRVPFLQFSPLDRYDKLFANSGSLPGTHVQAMAALFRWATPDEEEANVSESVV